MKSLQLYFGFKCHIIAGRDTLYTHDIELAFKRYVISSSMRPPFWWLFYFRDRTLQLSAVSLIGMVYYYVNYPTSKDINSFFL